jgi:hypothetical protein
MFSYVICVEHDLSVLDYLSDFICCLYGVPSVYGVVTLPFGVREGIYREAGVTFINSQVLISFWTVSSQRKIFGSVKKH